ncbi:hypothetical protein MMC10_001962 [Thelotrema lepadinum]|nr:hypothetical protein [Thelotrema lepadinum]
MALFAITTGSAPSDQLPQLLETPPAWTATISEIESAPRCQGGTHILSCGHVRQTANSSDPCSAECLRPVGYGAKLRRKKCQTCFIYEGEELLCLLLMYFEAQKRFYEALEYLEEGADQCLVRLDNWLENKVRPRIPRSIWRRYESEGSSKFQAGVYSRIRIENEAREDAYRREEERLMHDMDLLSARDAAFYLGEEDDDQSSDYEVFDVRNLGAGGGQLITNSTAAAAALAREEEELEDFHNFMSSQLEDIQRRRVRPEASTSGTIARQSEQANDSTPPGPAVPPGPHQASLQENFLNTLGDVAESIRIATASLQRPGVQPHRQYNSTAAALDFFHSRIDEAWAALERTSEAMRSGGGVPRTTAPVDQAGENQEEDQSGPHDLYEGQIPPPGAGG